MKGAWLLRPRKSGALAPAASDEGGTPEYLRDYRKTLDEAGRKSQEDFDKTLVALSGGALGVSFTYLKDIVGNQPIGNSFYLFLAWSLWAFSALSVLTSYLLSMYATRAAIRQVDTNSIHQGKPGGAFAYATEALNLASMSAFAFGVASISVFVYHNLPKEGHRNGNSPPAAASSAAVTLTVSCAAPISSAASRASSARTGTKVRPQRWVCPAVPAASSAVEEVGRHGNSQEVRTSEEGRNSQESRNSQEGRTSKEVGASQKNPSVHD